MDSSYDLFLDFSIVFCPVRILVKVSTSSFFVESSLSSRLSSFFWESDFLSDFYERESSALSSRETSLFVNLAPFVPLLDLLALRICAWRS
jgi:hypothetical protein